MTNQVKSYFLAPSWCHPATGAPGNTIALWNIVCDPRSVIPPIDFASEVPPTTPHYQDDVDLLDDAALRARFGVWAKFLAFAGLGGADASARGERTSEQRLHAQLLVTRECYPSKEQLRCMVSRHGPARRHLERFRFKEPLYIVVGVKEAHGASMRTARGASVGAQLSVGADLAAVGAPGVSVGPEAGVGANRREVASFGGSSSFVYAYRLQKIRVDAALNIELSEPKGAMLGADDGGDAPIRVHGLEEEDLTLPDTVGQREMVRDHDGEVCVTVLA